MNSLNWWLPHPKLIPIIYFYCIEFDRCRNEIGDEHTDHVGEQWPNQQPIFKSTIIAILSTIFTVSFKEGCDKVSVLTHTTFYIELFCLQSRLKPWVDDIKLIHTTSTNIQQSCPIHIHAHARDKEHYHATWCNWVFVPQVLCSLSQRLTSRDIDMGQLKTYLTFHSDEQSAGRNASWISVSVQVPIRLGIVLPLNKLTGMSPSLILVLRRGLSMTSHSSSSRASL